jgi:molybdopterin-guanine dinucleotide biosynthesis protein A
MTTNTDSTTTTQWGGILLAGGRSTRMGQEKGLVDYRGQPLARYAEQALAAVTTERCIVGQHPGYADWGLPQVPDEIPGAGPLGGLLSGMTFLAARGDFSAYVVLPCDMPLLGAAHLQRLAAHFQDGMPALVARAGGRLHPLVGIYTPACMSAMRAACMTDRLRMRDFLTEISAATLDFPAEDVAAFRNLNTPEDLLV